MRPGPEGEPLLALQGRVDFQRGTVDCVQFGIRAELLFYVYYFILFFIFKIVINST